MNSVEIIKMWYYGLTKPNKTVKELSKKKLKVKDGFLSLIYLSFILSFLISLFLLLISNSISLIEVIKIGVISFVGLSLIGVIGLYVFSWIFKKLIKKHKGKAKLEKIVGLFGLFVGMFALTVVPYFIGYSFTLLLKTTPLISYFLFGLGLLLTAGYSGRVTGLILEIVSDVEKVKVNEIGWIQGLTIGLLYLFIMSLTGLIMQLGL